METCQKFGVPGDLIRMCGLIGPVSLCLALLNLCASTNNSKFDLSTNARMQLKGNRASLLTLIGLVLTSFSSQVAANVIGFDFGSTFFKITLV